MKSQRLSIDPLGDASSVYASPKAAARSAKCAPRESVAEKDPVREIGSQGPVESDSKAQDKLPVFSETEEMEIGQLLKLCERETFQSGARIFKEGECGNEFYLVISGEVIIRVGDKEVARMRPGMVFSEMALLDDSKRTASAMLSETSLLFSIFRTILHSKMPTFANKVMSSIVRQLSEKLRDANQTIRKMQNSSSKKK